MKALHTHLRCDISKFRVCQLLLLLLFDINILTADGQLRLIHLLSACRGRTALRFPANSYHMCRVELALNMYGLLTKCEVKMAGYWPS